MKTPELKQFAEFEAEDFERYPVWIGCHTADYGKPWYDDTDEETFRPYDGDLPADPSEGMLLVRAVIQLKDGSTYPGFMTPGSDLGTQQPQIFVDDHRFVGFWGGLAGISERTQQEFYATLERGPESVFPLRFFADPGLASGIVEGQIDGFYRKSCDTIHVSFVCDREKRTSKESGWFYVSATSRGYPQPESEFGYRKIVYREHCFRCGVFDRQIAPFRFKKTIDMRSEFAQLNWVHDAFFVRPAILEEITQAGITGVSAGSVVHHRTGEECVDRVQLLIPTVVACAETSRLPTVTCRPDNEELMAFRAKLAKQKSLSETRARELEELLRSWKQKIAAIPYCGRVKYHPPTSLALIPDRLANAPDLFQTAEWFGSGGLAFRLTLASKRFANLVRERRWKGLNFHGADQGGWSERATTD